MTKLFVGSLPNGVTDDVLWAEFGKYGQVTEVYVKPDCEPGRQWAKIEYASYDDAARAKEATDRLLTLPGGDRPCDVQIAKNQGKGAEMLLAPDAMLPAQRGPTMSQYQPCKLFVGQLPDGTADATIREYFCQYGTVTDVFLKPGCETGRQWAFVTFESHEQAMNVIRFTHNILALPGAHKPCEVMLARNQGMFGQDKLVAGPNGPESISFDDLGPKKIFVGTLPDGITDLQLREEFSKYGAITDVYMKAGCEPGRQWAFLTFLASDSAISAKTCSDRVLMFPGAVRPCEVTLAKHQGMYGQNLLGEKETPNPNQAGGAAVRLFDGGAAGAWGAATYAQQGFAMAGTMEGPKKIFVGSLPDHITDQILRAEFSRFGQITDVFLKPGCESGRQWAFVTFATAEQAQYAKDSTDRVLVIPGADRACEVMLAKNQGKNGADPLHGGVGGYAVQQQLAWNPAPMGAIQPPPPASPPPPEATSWREYKTASGLPYYHNHATGVTQWEAPTELQVQADPNAFAAAAALAQPQVQYQDLMQTAYGAVPNITVGQAHYAPY